MIDKLKSKLKRYYQYYKAIKGWGALLCILDEIRKRGRERMIAINGVPIHLRTNTPDLFVAISGLYEEEYAYIHLSNPQVILDAGAHIGTSSIFFARKYPNAQVIAIEPEEENFDLLLKNTSQYKNIVAIRAAIWGTPEKRILQNRFTGQWGYTIAETSNRTESTGEEIDCLTIDILMKELGITSIDFLKMDIEGSEKDVLEKSAGWIDAVETITAELHDRICAGCEQAFYFATKDFKTFEMRGEKITAYRNNIQ